MVFWCQAGSCNRVQVLGVSVSKMYSNFKIMICTVVKRLRNEVRSLVIRKITTEKSKRAITSQDLIHGNFS